LVPFRRHLKVFWLVNVADPVHCRVTVVGMLAEIYHHTLSMGIDTVYQSQLVVALWY
jgi:hypothetical protein